MSQILEHVVDIIPIEKLQDRESNEVRMQAWEWLSSVEFLVDINEKASHSPNSHFEDPQLLSNFLMTRHKAINTSKCLEYAT